MTTSENQEPTTVEKMRGLPWGIRADAANTVFVQFTFFGSVFILFLSALGLSKSQMGFLLSLVPFSGIVAPFIAPCVARFGYKRTFMTFWYIRKIATAFLLLTPWVLSTFGLQATTLFVAAVMLVFALGRAIGETGKYPWLQEFIPASVRGKYSATSNIFTTLTGFVAVTVAGWVIGRFHRFLRLHGADGDWGRLWPGCGVDAWLYSRRCPHSASRRTAARLARSHQR